MFSKTFWRAAMLVASTIGIAGCADVPPPTAPSLEYMQPLPDHLSKVVIRNGHGDVIFDKRPKSYETNTVQPPAGTFDGTLNIEWQSEDGKKGTQTLTHDPKKSFKLKFDWSKEEFALQEQPNQQQVDLRMSTFLDAGYLARRLKGTGAFTNKTKDESALLKVKKLDGFKIGGGFKIALPTGNGSSFPQIFENARSAFQFSFDYTNLNGTAHNTTEPGGDETGITFPYEVDSSTGLNFGTTGAKARIKQKFQGFRFDATWRTWQLRGTTLPRLSLGLGAFGAYGKYDTRADIWNITYPSIYGSDRTKLNDYKGGLTMSTSLRYDIDALTPFVGVGADLYAHRSSLKGRQQTTAPGTLTAMQQMPLHYSDTESGFGAQIKGYAGVDVKPMPGVHFHVNGFVTYDTSAPYVDKRDNPSDSPTKAKAGGAFDYGALAGFRISF